MTLALPQELLMALRANDAEGLKCGCHWLESMKLVVGRGRQRAITRQMRAVVNAVAFDRGECCQGCCGSFAHLCFNGQDRIVAKIACLSHRQESAKGTLCDVVALESGDTGIAQAVINLQTASCTPSISITGLAFQSTTLLHL